VTTRNSTTRTRPAASALADSVVASSMPVMGASEMNGENVLSRKSAK
jgi:hypothetical protein